MPSAHPRVWRRARAHAPAHPHVQWCPTPAGRWPCRTAPSYLDLATFPERRAHLALERLARCIAGEILHDQHALDALVPSGHARIDPLLQFIGRHDFALAKHDGRDRRLAPFVVRNAEHGDLTNCRMLRGDLFDVPGI